MTIVFSRAASASNAMSPVGIMGWFWAAFGNPPAPPTGVPVGLHARSRSRSRR